MGGHVIRRRITDFQYSFVNIGCPGRLLTTEDPQLNEFEPTDDVAWDQAVSI